MEVCYNQVYVQYMEGEEHYHKKKFSLQNHTK